MCARHIVAERERSCRGLRLAPLREMRQFARVRLVPVLILAGGLATLTAAGTSTQGGAIPGPLPLFPADNWWNIDVSNAPLDGGSAGYISFINGGGTRLMHPDFGGDVSPGSAQIYGFPYIIVEDRKSVV